MEDNNPQYIYNRFKNVLSGCRTIIDAFKFANQFIKKYPGSKDIIYTMIRSKKYDNILDFKSIKGELEQLNLNIYREDVDEKINIIFKTCNEQEQIQKKSLMRISKIKPIKPQKRDKIIEYVLNDNIRNEMKFTLIKSCPHCGEECIADKDTDYIICGFQNTHKGFDWSGCGKDWCYKCEKMLCKEWRRDQLFVESNRIHDTKCCLEYANLLNEKYKDIIMLGKTYPDDYCQCINKNVKRF